jgi:hypothetical protein
MTVTAKCDTLNLLMNLVRRHLLKFVFSLHSPCGLIDFNVGEGTEVAVTTAYEYSNANGYYFLNVRRSEPITPVLRQLHWLPIRQRIHFKVACLAFLSLNGQAPAYLAEDCRLISDSTARQLRSSDGRKCVVPRTHNHCGDRSFSVSGPKIWNALPSTLRLPDISYTSFKRGLKTVLFQSYFD